MCITHTYFYIEKLKYFASYNPFEHYSGLLKEDDIVKKSHTKHSPVMQVLKDFSFKISHLRQREGDDDDEPHLTPAEVII